MTFKSIDLQMSVPRTQEFSGQHGQALHKPIAEQNMLANQSAKNTEELRAKNTGIEQAIGLHVRSDQEAQQGNDRQKARRKNPEDEHSEKEGDSPPVHPFKGHHLDIKL